MSTYAFRCNRCEREFTDREPKCIVGPSCPRCGRADVSELLTEDIEAQLAEADADAYEAWLSGDERAEALENVADRLRNELARRQQLETDYQKETAA